MQINQQSLVSIITVNYNQADVTCDLLKSAKNLSYAHVEIIVVDNASVENPTQKIKTVFPEAKIILSDKNLGFAGGNNLGIQSAKGELLFFINNDTVLTPDILENLIAVFQKNEKAGAVSPKIYYFDEPEKIQFAGYTRMNPCTGRNVTIGQFEIDKGQHDHPRNTAYAHGAAMMVHRKVIDKVGMMPDFFFLYFEEFDWSEQIKRAGFEILYEPKAKIYHKESVTTGKLSPLKTYYETRNRILFMRRNAGNLQLIALSISLAFFTIPKNLLLYLLKGEIELARSFLRGIIWNILHKTPGNMNIA